MSRYHLTQQLHHGGVTLEPLGEEWYVLDTHTGDYVWIDEWEGAYAEVTRLNAIPEPPCPFCYADMTIMGDLMYMRGKFPPSSLIEGLPEV